MAGTLGRGDVSFSGLEDGAGFYGASPVSSPGRARSVAFLLVAVLMLLGGGCATLGPDFVRPEAPVAPEWVEARDAHLKAISSDFSRWWTVFEDPVLDSLVEKAYTQNLTLQIAGIRIMQARAELGIAVGNFYPQLQQGFGGYSRVAVSRNAANSQQAKGYFDDFQFGFDAAWELDFWGRFRRNIESADASLVASVADYDDVLVSLVAEVARAYVLVRTFQERLKLAEENVKIQKRTLEITEVLYENGAVTELDVQQARSLLKNTQALIPQLQAGLRQAQHSISTLLGLPPGELRDMLDKPRPIPKAPPEVVVGIPAELLRRRPDILRAEMGAAAQCARIGVAETALYPHFSLAGSIGLNSEDLQDLLESRSTTGFIGPAFQWDILNYGRLKNNIRVQDALFQEAIVRYRDTVLKAQQEVEDSMVGYLRAKDQTEFLSESVEASERAVELALIQYRDGAVDYTRVLNTQDFLVQQQDRLTETRGASVNNLIAMYKALGGGWQLRMGGDFISDENREAMTERTDWGGLMPPEDLPQAKEPPPSARIQKKPRLPDF